MRKQTRSKLRIGTETSAYGSDHDFYGPQGRYRSDHISLRRQRLA